VARPTTAVAASWTNAARGTSSRTTVLSAPAAAAEHVQPQRHGSEGAARDDVVGVHQDSLKAQGHGQRYPEVHEAPSDRAVETESPGHVR
jgi:hypothetical protein